MSKTRRITRAERKETKPLHFHAFNVYFLSMRFEGQQVLLKKPQHSFEQVEKIIEPQKLKTVDNLVLFPDLPFGALVAAVKEGLVHTSSPLYKTPHSSSGLRFCRSCAIWRMSCIYSKLRHERVDHHDNLSDQSEAS